MNETKLDINEVLLNLTVAVFPVAGMLIELQKRAGEKGVPGLWQGTFDRFGDAPLEAILLLPEETLRPAVLASIPEDTSPEVRTYAEKQIAYMFDQAKGLRPGSNGENTLG